MTTVSASILSADFLSLETSIRAMDLAGIDSFHLDVMDGHFVPNLSFGPDIIRAVSTITKKPLFTHLMIHKPWQSFDLYCHPYITGIWVHAEAYTDKYRLNTLERDLTHIHARGIQAGIVLNMKTTVASVQPVLALCDQVLLMSVEPGYASQAFMPAVIPKVAELAGQYTGRISVDGGVNAQHAPALIAAGATDLISASYLFKAPQYKSAIKSLKA